MSLFDAPSGVDEVDWERMLSAACDAAENKSASQSAAPLNIFSNLKPFKLTPCKRTIHHGVFRDGATKMADEKELRSALARAGVSEKDFESKRTAFVQRMSNISPEDARKIAAMPQHLADGRANDEWLASRRHRITGSITGSIFGCNKYQSQDDTLESLLRPNFKGNAACAYGNQNEDNAESSFEHYLKHSIVGTKWGPEQRLVTGFDLETPGLCVCTTKPGLAMFGMSPDGVLTLHFDDGHSQTVLVEYKAPYSRRQLNTLSKIDETTNLYKVNDLPGTLVPSGPVPPYYFTQINYGCGILGLPLAFFVVWVPACTPSDTVVLTHTGGAGSSALAVTPSGTIQITECTFDSDFFETKLFPCLSRFWHERYVPDACRLELGIPVPRRSTPPKPRSWFGKRSKDVQDRDAGGAQRRHAFSSRKHPPPASSPALPPAKRRFKFSERRQNGGERT